MAIISISTDIIKIEVFPTVGDKANVIGRVHTAITAVTTDRTHPITISTLIPVADLSLFTDISTLSKTEIEQWVMKVRGVNYASDMANFVINQHELRNQLTVYPITNLIN